VIYYEVGVGANLQFCEVLLLDESSVFKSFSINARERGDEFWELLPRQNSGGSFG
jgi:hypothetical protein